MPEQVLKSPGYYDREIDLSVRVAEPTGTPTTVVGAARKGPAFVPTTLGSYPDFETKFGSLDPKLVAGYAVQQVLASKPAAVFIRTLGAGANTVSTDFYNTIAKGIVVNAGMQVTGTVVGGGDNRHAGAVQFIVAKHKVTSSEAFGFPMFSDNDSFTLTSNYAYLVRATLFTTYDTRIMLMNSNESFGGLLDDAATIDDTSTNSTYRKFKIAISSSAGASFAKDDGNAGVRILTASLDPSDTTYIGKILNTDPEKFETYKHLLYSDFAVDGEIAPVASGAGNSNSVAVVSGTINTSATSGDTSLVFRNAFGRFDTRFTTPKTPWFISQPFGATEYDLFYAESLDDGAYANNKYKISVINIKASSDPRNDFGTFTLVVRQFDDTDMEPKVLEQFNNLSLNPSDDSYVAKAIGDKKVAFFFDVEEESDRKLKITGKNPVRSKFIRVIMNPDLEAGRLPLKCLPFGFRGFEFLNTNTLLADSQPSSTVARLNASGTFDARMTGSILPPMPYRFKVTRGEISASSVFTGAPGPNEVVDTRLYWGVKFERNSNVMNTNIASEPNTLISSLTKFQGIKKLDTLVSGTRVDAFNNNKFTLARVALSNQTLTTVTASAAQHMKETAYIRNGVPDPSNYYISDGAWGNRVTFATLLSKGASSDFNRFSDFAKFTTVMVGGWDGINILDQTAGRFSDKATSTETGGAANGNYTSPGATSGVNYSGVGVLNNAVHSFRTAVNIATDTIIANNNVLAIPGQREPLVADYATQKNSDYGLSFYIMDIPNYDADGNRIFDGDIGRFIDVRKTADSFDSRAIDNNAVAAYFPNFVMDDTINNRRVTVPASVAGVAAFSFNDKVAYPWFIPAGFNRNALNFVVIPATRINQPDRDKLFDVRINPIVKFPSEGYVFFSQRTLQQAKTALESINVKRMLLEVKRIIVELGNKILFEQMTSSLRSQFIKDASSQLSTIQLQRGIELFQVVCDDTNNNEQDRQANRMNAQVRIVPTRGVEYIVMDFIVTNSGVQFV